MNTSFEIRRATSLEPSPRLSELFSELYGYELVPDISRINSLIAEGKIAFYLVESQGEPVGMATVIPCRTATTDKLWIEDVCILDSCRGHGLGRKLLSFVLSDASELFGRGTFWLTSNPTRTAARALYKSLGFQEYETGVFFCSNGTQFGDR